MEKFILQSFDMKVLMRNLSSIKFDWVLKTSWVKMRNSGRELSFETQITVNLAFFNDWHYSTQQKKNIMNRRKKELEEFVYLYNCSHSERASEGGLARIHVYPKP